MAHMNDVTPAVSFAARRDPVAVIGAGAMGSGVAQVAALAGHQVYLVDAREGAAQEACARLGATLEKLAAKGKFTAEQASAATARLHPASIEELPACQVVIEAIVENLDVKRQVFSALAATQPATAVLASNTSSLDITAIAEGLSHPERVIGLHFFNPAAVMKLVEVVHGAASSPTICDDAAELMRAWGKTPVRCASTPGFIVNRVARPYYGEAQRLVEAGVCDAATVDFCLTHHAGFAMGPMALTDLIGHDVNYRVGESVWEQTDRDPRYQPTACQKALVDAGHFGRKTGQGFFQYVDGAPADAVPDEARAQELVGGPVVTDPVARTLAMLINEAVDLVHRGEASAADVDTAMRLGTNYPRGLIAWGQEIGFDVVERQLRELDAAFPGGRYRPSPGLSHAASWTV